MRRGQPGRSARRRSIYSAWLACALLLATVPLARPASGAASCRGQTATIEGTDGDDVLQGTDGPDVISAGKGADTVHAGDGNDVICGEEDADVLDPGHGGDTISGGSGNDWANYADAEARIYGRLGRYGSPGTTGASGDFSDELFGIENIEGSAFDDIIGGGDGDNVLKMGGGNDKFVWDFTDVGDDTWDGGPGEDTALYYRAPGPVHADLAGNVEIPAAPSAGADALIGVEVVGGSAFPDDLRGNDDANKIYGSSGPGSDAGTYAADSQEANTMQGGGGDDRLFATGGDHVMHGGAGNDRLTGGEGNDQLFGEEGDDLLNGGGGNDQLQGGPGADVLSGGYGHDSCAGDADDFGSAHCATNDDPDQPDNPPGGPSKVSDLNLDVVEPTEPGKDGQLTYKLTVTNLGPDDLPAAANFAQGLLFYSAGRIHESTAGNGFSCGRYPFDIAPDVYNYANCWNDEPLANGTSVTMTIEVCPFERVQEGNRFVCSPREPDVEAFDFSAVMLSGFAGARDPHRDPVWENNVVGSSACPAGMRGSPRLSQGGTCAAPSVELTALEITQGIQDLKGTVPLIRDRRTFVRAHVRTGPLDQPFDMTARLVGTDVETSAKLGELTPLNRNADMKPGYINVTRKPDRSKLEDSFLFELPDDWVSFFHQKVEIRFQVEDRDLKCNAKYGGSAGTCSATISTKPQPALDLMFVPLEWTAKDGSKQIPNARDLALVVRQIRASYPIAEDGFKRKTSETHYAPRFKGPFSGEELYNAARRIRYLRAFDGCVLRCKRIYMGVALQPSKLSQGDPPVTRGTALSSFGGGVAAAAFIQIDDPNDLAVSHELGHLLMGSDHVVCAKNGDEEPADFDYPYLDGLISNTGLGVSDDEIFFGLNTNKTGLPKVMLPKESGDLMSYCSQTWPSDYTYNKLYEALKNHFGLARTTLAPTSGSTIVSGTLAEDLSSGTIDSVVSIDTPADPSESGGYALRVRDSAGSELGTYPFEPFTYLDFAPAFVESIPADSAAHKIEILHNGQLIGERTASPNAPMLELNLQSLGSIDRPVVLAWAASDSDADPLTFAVQYSADTGTTWNTLATDLTEESFTLDPARLAATDAGAVRVIASDGFNTTVATSTGSIRVGAHDPEVSISSPTDFAGISSGQTLSFEGNAYDVEDGALTGDSLEWSVDGTAAFATGGMATISGGDLGTGSHIVTLRAIDSGGGTAEASLTITVFERVGAIPRCRGLYATAVGTRAADVMTGTEGADIIVGLGGNDTITALDGNDVLCGDSGKDTLAGGSGKDRLEGGPGKDMCTGNAGKDRFATCEKRKQ